tara:strand:+ start:296 stop:517 length:222 start_codon:yes stop_codon:yes gene_type:complete
MDVLIYLIPAALFLGLIGLVAFFWAMKSGQFDDLDGAAERILLDDEDIARPNNSRNGNGPLHNGNLPFQPPCH